MKTSMLPGGLRPHVMAPHQRGRANAMLVVAMLATLLAAMLLLGWA